MPNDSPDVVMRKSGQTVVFPRQNLLKLRSLGWVEVKQEPPKGDGDKNPSLWKAANLPVGEQAFRKKGITGGIPQKNRFAIADMVGKMDISDENKRRLAYALDIPMELLTSIPEAGRKMTTPLGVATMGLGSLLQRLRELKGVPTAVKALVGAGETGTAAGFGASGARQAITPIKPDESIEDYIERIGTGAGQSLFGLSALGHVAGPTLKGTGREYVGIGKTAVEETAQKRVGAKEVYKEEASQATVKARSEYEAGEAKRDAKIEADRVVAKVKHEAEIEATKRGYGESVSNAERAKIRESRLESAKRSLSDAKDRYAEEAAENFDKAEAAEKKSLDSRYQDFRQKFLGVTKETPNGTVQSELTPVGDAIIDARKNVLKGSKENIPIFNSILSRLGDMIETPTGELKPLQGQMIPTDQLRGYITELNDRIYEADLPYDVRGSLKNVVKAGQKQVIKTIEDVGGKTGTSIYEKLNADYSDYMDTWRDKSSGSPLPKIRGILRSSIATKRGVAVYREIGKLIEGTKGEKIIDTIARKRAFGADPSLPAKLRKAAETLDSLPRRYGRIPVVKRPEFPKFKEPTPPEETKFAKYDFPKPPENLPTDPESIRRELIQKEVQTLAHPSKWEMSFPPLRLHRLLIKAILEGKFPFLKRIPEWLARE